MPIVCCGKAWRPRLATRTLFYAIVASAIVILIAPLYGWGKEIRPNNKVQIVFGQTNPVCLESIKIVRGMPRSDFWSGKWRSGFGEVVWHTDSYPTITAEGKHSDVTYQYLPLNIYNDGSTQVVVKHTDMFTSVFWDWLYVLQSDEFNLAQQEGAIGKILGSSTAPELNARNFAIFTNGRNANPTELHIWRHQAKNYLLMKENQFAWKEKKKKPQSLYVGILNGAQSSKFDTQFQVQRLYPKMICQLTWR